MQKKKENVIKINNSGKFADITVVLYEVRSKLFVMKRFQQGIMLWKRIF
jgi:hypothetical protein